MVIVITRLDIAQSQKRSKINEILYCLQNDINKIINLPDLIQERDGALEEVYNFSYGVVSYEPNEPGYSGDPYYLATKIIGVKEYYNKRIERILKRDKEINSLLDSLPLEDSQTLRRAFFTAEKVDEIEVKKTIRKHLPKFEEIYNKDDEKEGYLSEDVRVDNATKRKRIAKSLEQLMGGMLVVFFRFLKQNPLGSERIE